MRKLLALLLIVVLVFSLASLVYASGDSPTGTTETNPEDTSEPESPPTGIANASGDMILLLAPIMLLGLFGVIFAVRKLAKNH